MANSKIRRVIQFVSALVCNADIRQWGSGGISRSPLKRVCVPGLNCYSCPAAVAGCPLGALQNGFASGRVPLFVIGFLLVAGAAAGRLVCSFLCPAGLVQELLHKIKTRKVHLHENARLLAITRGASLVKYAVLGVLCVVLPLVMYTLNGAASPLFCKYICPAGTIGAGVPLVAANEGLRAAAGLHFVWKCTVAAVFAIWSVFWFRPFCTFVCPLGAVYSLFNRIAIFGPVVDEAKCIHCGKCSAACKMPTPMPLAARRDAVGGDDAAQTSRREAVYMGAVNDRECIRCGECAASCPTGAIRWGKLVASIQCK